MREYDVVVIVDPRLSEEEVAQRATRLQDSLTALGGEVVGIENWGKRRLTFEIGKQREGTYLLLQIRGEPRAVREYERQLKLNESVLRFMTTRVIERRRPAAPAEPMAGPEAVTEPTAEEPTPEEVG